MEVAYRKTIATEFPLRIASSSPSLTSNVFITSVAGVALLPSSPMPVCSPGTVLLRSEIAKINDVSPVERNCGITMKRL